MPNFVREDKALLLDKICRRYGGRPSDYLDLDEHQSFQFDAAMAHRYGLIDEDIANQKFTSILNAINNILKSWGAKGVKTHDYKPMVDAAKEKAKDNIVTGAITNMTVTEIVDETKP